MSTEQENFWTAGRIIATVVVVALVATIGYTLFSHTEEGPAVSNVTLPDTNSSPAATPMTANAKAVPDFEVPHIDGGSFKLSSYRGKVLVVDFWAVWCPPCRQEIPQLVRLARDNKERGVEVVGLHIDDRGRTSRQAMRNFINQFGINYPVGIASDEMFIAYLGEKDDSIPQTLVFDRNGKVVAHLIGYDSTHAAKLDAAINKAIADS